MGGLISTGALMSLSNESRLCLRRRDEWTTSKHPWKLGKPGSSPASLSLQGMRILLKKKRHVSPEKHSIRI